MLSRAISRTSFLAGRQAFGSMNVRMFSKVGDQVPNVDLHFGFPPEKINLPERCEGNKVILVSLPGAFTPT
jgi:hypothetical protein